MLPIEERSRYQSDYCVSWLRLPALVVVALLVAVAVAWSLKFAWGHGWYLIILLPTAGGAILGGVLYVLVGWSHCRNCWLAGCIGILAALLTYLGYYHFCLADLLPPGNAWRVDLLPKYISFRMKTDVVEDVAAPKANPQANKKPVTFMNYWAFVWELSMVVGLAATIPWKRARQAYCVELGQWMRRETALLASHSITNFRAALDTETLSQFVAHTAAGSDAQTASRLILEYAVPETGSALEFPMYASFEDFPTTQSWYRLRRRRVLLRQVELELAEVMALLPRFANLAKLLQSQHAELRDFPVDVVEAANPPLATTDVAEIVPVAEPYRQRVRAKGYNLRVNLLGFSPVLYIFAGLGLAVGGVVLFKNASIPLGCAAIAVGAVGIFWGVYVSQFCFSAPENRWIERRLRQEIDRRPDRLVDPQDEQAIFVSLTPRENFAKIKWTTESDVLLLKVDDKRRQVLMEGDSDCYRIPAGAISVCEPQCFFLPLDAQHSKQLWMVHLMIRVEQGGRELLLSVGHTNWRPQTNKRRRQIAEDMCRRIAEF